jgi:NDP-sugar pyrophosphorylase family protein
VSHDGPAVRAGVIAAGWGERLQPSFGTPKALVPVGGAPLIEHVLTSLAETSPDEVVIIVNETSRGVCDYVSSRGWPFDVRWIVETTPSSMHSFLRVLEALAGSGGAAGVAHDGPFLLSTVDTVALPGAYEAFARASRSGVHATADVVLAVAPVSDDEKPLSVRVAETGLVTAIGAAAAGSPVATAGYYYVRPTVLSEADSARRDGLTALRAFFQRVHAREFRFSAVSVAESVDVDRPTDVAAAERLLRQVSA